MPFTLEVEQYIRRAVPAELEGERVEALGSWDDDILAALSVFKPHAQLWVVTVVATAHQYRRRKQAFRLKREVVRLAANSNATAVTSHVHRDNGPMSSLNRKLGGIPDPASGSDNDYVLWTIPAAPTNQ